MSKIIKIIPKSVRRKARKIKKEYILDNEANKRVYYISILICFITLILSIIFHCIKKDFGKNICIGIFASSFLALIVSLVNYLSIRRETLESFFDVVMRIAKTINMYDFEASLDYKNNYLLEMYRNDFDKLDHFYTKIALVLPVKDRLYVYKKIYHPIDLVRQKIGNYSQAMIKYQNRKDGDIQSIVSEIEDAFLTTASDKCRDDRVLMGISKKTIAYGLIKELSGRYYKLMYSKSLEEDKEYYLYDD